MCSAGRSGRRNEPARTCSCTATSTSQTVDGQTTTYSHNAADQLTQAGTTAFSYDGNGNELSRSDGRAAAYNAKEQTTSMTAPGGSPIPMSYSGTGQFRRVSAGGTAYQNNALGLGRKTTGGGSTTYLRDSEGSLLEQRTPGGDYYYLFDGLGSAVALTDTSGNISATYKYEPFGKLVSSTGTVANPWRFLAGLGVYWDAQADLHKMGTRYYDPTLGRFTQVDPIAGGSANAYDYASQNPVNFVDPDGTFIRGIISKGRKLAKRFFRNRQVQQCAVGAAVGAAVAVTTGWLTGGLTAAAAAQGTFLGCGGSALLSYLEDRGGIWARFARVAKALMVYRASRKLRRASALRMCRRVFTPSLARVYCCGLE
jgi:RHS repeat-associated protein